MPCMDDVHYEYIRLGSWRWLFQGEMADWLEYVVKEIGRAGKASSLPEVLLEWRIEKPFVHVQVPDKDMEFEMEQMPRIRLIKRHSSPIASLLCLAICYAESNDIVLEMPEAMKVWWDEHRERDGLSEGRVTPKAIVDEEVKLGRNLDYYRRTRAKAGEGD